MFAGSRFLANNGLASCGVSYPDTTEIDVKIKNLPPFGGVVCSGKEVGSQYAVTGRRRWAWEQP